MEWGSMDFKGNWCLMQVRYRKLKAPDFLPGGQKNEWLLRVFFVKEDVWIKHAQTMESSPSTFKSIDGHVQVLSVTLTGLQNDNDPLSLYTDGFCVPLLHPIFNFPGTKSRRLMRLNSGKTGGLHAHAMASMRLTLQRIFVDGASGLQGGCLPSERLLACLPEQGTFRPATLITNDHMLAFILESIGNTVMPEFMDSFPVCSSPIVKGADTDPSKRMMVICGHCSYTGVSCGGDSNLPLMKRCAKCMVTWYCNGVCQGDDWKAKHQAGCEVARLSADNFLAAVMNTLAVKEANAQHKNFHEAQRARAGISNPNAPFTFYTDEGIMDGNVFLYMQGMGVGHARETQTCKNCGKFGGADMKACTKCGKELYCDRECRGAHWSKHKKQCGKA